MFSGLNRYIFSIGYEIDLKWKDSDGEEVEYKKIYIEFKSESLLYYENGKSQENEIVKYVKEKMESCQLLDFKDEFRRNAWLPDSIKQTRAVIIIEEIPLN